MERLNGLSLATQQISVKGGTRLLAIPYINSHPLSRVCLNLCTQSLSLWVPCATCRTLSALLPDTGYLAPGDILLGLLCSLVSAAW